MGQKRRHSLAPSLDRFTFNCGNSRALAVLGPAFASLRCPLRPRASPPAGAGLVTPVGLRPPYVTSPAHPSVQGTELLHFRH
jgi:hypothetical protein